VQRFFSVGVVRFTLGVCFLYLTVLLLPADQSCLSERVSPCLLPGRGGLK